MRSTTSVSLPRDALWTGTATALPASGSPSAAARSAARSGSGGEFRTRRTTRLDDGISSTSSASRPARNAANSTTCRAASAGYCASPCLTSVCQPEHQRWIGAVAVSTRVTSLVAQHLLEGGAVLLAHPVEVLARQHQRADLVAAALGQHVGECLPPASAALEGDRRAEQVRGQAVGERPQQRAEQPVVTRWARWRRRVPDGRVVGVRAPPRLLQRRGPRLVQPRVDDDLHAGSLPMPNPSQIVRRWETIEERCPLGRHFDA